MCHVAVLFFPFGFRLWQAGEACSPECTRGISRNQGSELSNTTIVPQSNAVADIARSEDKLNLIPGNAAGTATHVSGSDHCSAIRGWGYSGASADPG